MFLRMTLLPFKSNPTGNWKELGNTLQEGTQNVGWLPLKYKKKKTWTTHSSFTNHYLTITWLLNCEAAFMHYFFYSFTNSMWRWPSKVSVLGFKWLWRVSDSSRINSGHHSAKMFAKITFHLHKKEEKERISLQRVKPQMSEKINV